MDNQLYDVVIFNKSTGTIEQFVCLSMKRRYNESAQCESADSKVLETIQDIHPTLDCCKVRAGLFSLGDEVDISQRY